MKKEIIITIVILLTLLIFLSYRGLLIMVVSLPVIITQIILGFVVADVSEDIKIFMNILISFPLYAIILYITLKFIKKWQSK